MQGISIFLEKFKNLTIPDETVRKAFVEAFKVETGTDVPLSDTRVKNGVLYVELSPGAKSEMIIKKRAILARIYEVCDPKKLGDIK